MKLSRVKTIMGASQVGYCAMDSNVGLGLKTTPKIRPTELTGGVGSGNGVTGLAMFSSSHDQKDSLIRGSSTSEYDSQLQAGRVYRNLCGLRNAREVEGLRKP
jgi:hypothetical protein